MFAWPVGSKLPSGCQLLDGSRVSEGAEPQPDGSVLLINGSTVSASQVILPDGVKLADVTKPTGRAPAPVRTMPDGSKPSHGTWWWTYAMSQPGEMKTQQVDDTDTEPSAAEPSADAPKKKSRFGLPSFWSPSTRKKEAKPEGRTGMLLLWLLYRWSCNIYGVKLVCARFRPNRYFSQFSTVPGSHVLHVGFTFYSTMSGVCVGSCYCSVVLRLISHEHGVT